jgi:UDPglucose 6-dehydrogenase
MDKPSDICDVKKSKTDTLPNIGIVGFGFLGRALAHGFSLHANIWIYDKYDNTHNTLYDTVNKSDFVFIGVPTPMKTDGSQDLSYIKDAVFEVNKVAIKSKIIVLRSTVIPKTTRKIANEYPRHRFVFFPEFLTERTAKLDFINASRIIFGGQKGVTDKLVALFRTRFPHTPIYQTTWEAAELVKYMANCFFAVKISYLNEIYKIAAHLNVDFKDLKNMWLADWRIGNSHCDVPGHDGHFGYGGKCFPKDVKAFIKWAEYKGLDINVCKAADEVNEIVRGNKDWFDIKGATTSNGYSKREK